MNQQVTIRSAIESDRSVLEKIWQYCFRDGETFAHWYFSQYYRQSECLVATVGEVLAASLQIIDLPMRLGEEIVRCGYIVGVDCMPEYRGHGLTRQLMQTVISEYAPLHGLQLLHLMPFEAEFYTPYGFVFSDYHFDMDLAISEFYHTEDRASARRHHWQWVLPETLDNWLETLETLYERATAHYDGCILRRGLRRWQALVDDLNMEGGSLHILFDDDETPVGLFAYALKEEVLFVREALYINSDAQKAIYYFIAAHRSQVKRVQWSAPEDESVVFCRKKDKSGVAYQPFMMSLLLDAQILPLLASQTPLEDLSFKVEGKGCYRWAANSARLEKISFQEDLAVFSLKRLTALAFDRSLRLGDFKANEEKLARCFYKKATVFYNEYF